MDGEIKMYDGNSLAIGWPDIRDYGYRDWTEYEEEQKKNYKIKKRRRLRNRAKSRKYKGRKI